MLLHESFDMLTSKNNVFSLNLSQPKMTTIKNLTQLYNLKYLMGYLLKKTVRETVIVIVTVRHWCFLAKQKVTYLWQHIILALLPMLSKHVVVGCL